jgi:tetratricopeptide (TPR) repeat protein
MKTNIRTIVTALFAFIALGASAQTMEENLKAAVQQFDTSKTVNAMMVASSQLDLLSSKYPNEAMTNYYSAYAKAMISYKETNAKKRDLFLDQADKYYEKVKQLNPENDETCVLGALIANARIAIDGKNRYKQYGEPFDKNLEKAKALNPNNPRIYYLRGVSTFYTPKMFGGGAKRAKPYFEKAKSLFATQDKSSVMKPYWGEWMNEDYLKQCDK